MNEMKKRSEKELLELFDLKMYKAVAEYPVSTLSKKVLYAKAVSFAALGDIDTAKKYLDKYLGKWNVRKKKFSESYFPIFVMNFYRIKSIRF
jgi:hypothetical protein